MGTIKTITVRYGGGMATDKYNGSIIFDDKIIINAPRTMPIIKIKYKLPFLYSFKFIS